MNRAEAIDIMKVIVHMLEEKYDTDRVEEAVDMAIEALSSSEKPNKSECEHDHEILKAYSDGASAVLDKVRAEIDGLLNDEDNSLYEHGVMDCLEIIDKYAEEGKA